MPIKRLKSASLTFQRLYQPFVSVMIETPFRQRIAYNI
jgi:hypothetical protein